MPKRLSSFFSFSSGGRPLCFMEGHPVEVCGYSRRTRSILGGRAIFPFEMDPNVSFRADWMYYGGPRA